MQTVEEDRRSGHVDGWSGVQHMHELYMCFHSEGEYWELKALEFGDEW